MLRYPRKKLKIYANLRPNDDERRTLTPFNTNGFPPFKECKVITFKGEEVVLGNHSHTHDEFFILSAGTCTVRTYTEAGGVQECELSAPTLFSFESGEEHRVTGQEGTVLVGFSPVSFEEENNTAATHL